ncbi:MAG: ribonuclease D [Rhodospirillaceae bacterium TMED8]|nr:ribonuclease D [Magnetovibrio sp.]OUT50876.1 MAG: ribonuclease D [Rhodospirillaceae bacterium TMED8]|tara:strand:- start:2509 stop:3660 length:1152 start_codon:yes stop_codon:yes gene_type:complete
MTLITTTDQLSNFCKPLHRTSFVTVDTEFMRENTYWPILCLVQIAGPNNFAAIDPLAKEIDLTPLFNLLRDTNVVKVFHAARQDIEIFLNLMDEVPAPVFDTQVAAMVCGYGESVGYDNLILKLTNIQLDKGPRFTDWSLRPLSNRQLEYALADVTHLRIAYEKLYARLEREQRGSWIEEEMANLAEPTTYRIEPMMAYQRIKVRSGKGKFLSVLRELAAWRELEARRRDVPRNRVLKDESLTEIAHNTPTNSQLLVKSRGLSAKVAEGQMGNQILNAVKRGLSVPQINWPKPIEKPDLPRNIGPVVDLLKVLLKKVSDETNVAGRLIANSADIELIAGLGEDAAVAALKGWRRQIFGADALRLRAGQLSIAIYKNKLIIEDR